MEVEIAGKVYVCGKLDLFVQTKVAKRLLPIFASVGPDALREAANQSKAIALADESSPTDGANEGDAFADIDLSSVIGPLSDGIGGLSDDSIDFIIREVAKVTKRREGTALVAIWNRSANAMQFDDIDLPEMVQLIFYTLTDTMRNFWKGPQDRRPVGF